MSRSYATAAIDIFRRECFLRDVRALVHRLVWCAAALLIHSSLSGGDAIEVAIEDLQGPGFAASSLKGTLSGRKFDRLSLDIGRFAIGDRTWRNVHLTCAQIVTERRRMSCPDGVLDAGEKIPFEFSYSRSERAVSAILRPAPAESWRIDGRLQSGSEWKVTIAAGRLARIAAWLPPGAPGIKAGNVAGEVRLTQGHIVAHLDVDDAAFGDASGLHAGEKLRASIAAEATREGERWNFSGRLEWQNGEVFWQPLYLKATGQRADIEGTSDGKRTEVTRARLHVPPVGDFDISAAWDHAAGLLEYVEARSSSVAGDGLYEQWLRPALQGGALSDLQVRGQLAVAVAVRNQQLQSFDLSLADVSVEDKARRFALSRLNGRIPWQREGPTTAELTVESGRVLEVPFGSFRLPLRLSGARVAASEVHVPVFDGMLVLKDLATAERADGRAWRFSGELTPVSMERLSTVLGIPVMHGTMSGHIPDVIFYRSVLELRGRLTLQVFDGTVTAENIQLIEPFGKAPRLHADVQMRNLDLDLLTRTYSFGNMAGRVDASIAGLELVDWQPVRFDARLASSPGDYPRRISQTAVENISALGGAGAAAALQRTFLRFFKQFGYDRLGWSCRLENGVCEMGGIQSAGSGFVIVKGGGIPAISVIGYNRHVSWAELVDRLKRITQENVHPIVK